MPRDREKRREYLREYRSRNAARINAQRKARGDHKKRLMRLHEQKQDPAYRARIVELKAAARRRAGAPTREEMRACAEARAAAKAEAKQAAAPTRKRLYRELRTLLGRLFDARCAEINENPDAVQYRVRYQNDPAFRDREVARAWARKEKARPRLSAPAPEGETALTSADIRRMFGQARHCAYCSAAMHPREKTLDHLVPVSRGGAHTRENVVVACHKCNTKKQRRTPLEFAVDVAVFEGCGSSLAGF